jgi:hypothetical protein
MAIPARESAPAREPADPERKPDPRASGWADVRQMMTVSAQAAALAVEEMRGRPDDGAAVFMADLTRAALERAAVIAGRCAVDEAVLAEVDRRAYARGCADTKAARRRMGFIDGGQPG